MLKAKRMTSPELSKSLQVVVWIGIIAGWVLMWFIPYSIDMAFWIGLGIIVLGLIIVSLSAIAAREHPEKKQAVVDWGIYRVSRHPQGLSDLISHLGAVIMGWNPNSVIYLILWVYLVLYASLMHLALLKEEKLNVKKFGQEYADYMKKVPRYFFANI